MADISISFITNGNEVLAYLNSHPKMSNKEIDDYIKEHLKIRCTDVVKR